VQPESRLARRIHRVAIRAKAPHLSNRFLWA
jgi:hypothetical protein